MTTVERIEEYGMAVPVEEQVGFRERLAYGAAPVWIEHAQPIRHIEGIKIKDPVSGEWRAL